MTSTTFRLFAALALLTIIGCAPLREINDEVPSDEKVSYPKCETLSVIRFLRTKSGNTHSLQAVIKAEKLSRTRGFVLEYTPLPGLKTPEVSKSQPSLITGQGRATFLLAQSTSPFSKSDLAIAAQVNFSGCPEISQMDILVKGRAGFTYIVQRSQDLVNWQDIETITLRSNRIIWRGSALMLRRTPTPAREFYRLKTTCPPEEDCTLEKIRLENSARELRKTYGLTY